MYKKNKHRIMKYIFGGLRKTSCLPLAVVGQKKEFPVVLLCVFTSFIGIMEITPYGNAYEKFMNQLGWRILVCC